MKHLMVDLETMGTRVNAPVLAIGAVFFDPMTGTLGKTFDRRIDVADAMRYGVADGNTLKWWMQQDAAARKLVYEAESSASDVFNDFVQFVGSNTQPWGNGASFDISILDYAIPKITGKQPPWKFWNVRDCRTVKELARGVVPDYTLPREGVHHSALDDAIYQAKWVSHFWQNLRQGVVATVEPKATALDL